MTALPDTLRRESAIVAGLTLVGAVLRFWREGHVGLNHFDEGIYALAGLWIQSPKGVAAISPEVIAYAPPLFPILVGISYLLTGGPSDVAAIVVSQIAGVLTIPAVAWVGRRTFGPGAGAAAAAFAALSGPHIAFSRMALTDSTFLLMWTLALGLGGWFLEKPGVVRAILFGAAVGLAQNTKYSGYLAGLIVAGAALWGLILPDSNGRRNAVRAILFGLIAAGVAALMYWPWYRFVEAQPGGYQALVKHHQGYLSGIAAWPGHWRLQLAQSVGLTGEFAEGLTWGVAVWPLAWLAGWLFLLRTSRDTSRPHMPGIISRMGFIAGTAVLACAPNAGWWMGFAALPWWLVYRRVSVRVLGITWLVMSILTPFYHPYARLWLPLHEVSWLALAGLIVEARDEANGETAWGRSSSSRRAKLAAIGAAIASAVIFDAVIEPRARSLGSPIAPTDSLRSAVTRLPGAMNFASTMKVNPNPNRLLLLVPPPVMFYLLSQSELPMVRFGDSMSLIRARQPGDEAVIDSSLFLQGVTTDDFEEINGVLNFSLRNQYFSYQSSPATWADVEPSAVFDRLTTNRGSLQYYPMLKPKAR